MERVGVGGNPMCHGAEGGERRRSCVCVRGQPGKGGTALAALQPFPRGEGTTKYNLFGVECFFSGGGEVGIFAGSKIALSFSEAKIFSRANPRKKHRNQ